MNKAAVFSQSRISWKYVIFCFGSKGEDVISREEKLSGGHGREAPIWFFGQTYPVSVFQRDNQMKAYLSLIIISELLLLLVKEKEVLGEMEFP